VKIVKTGRNSRIYTDGLVVTDKIPVGNYKICFHPMMGFYLEDADEFTMKEKQYGKHPSKINKILNMYKNSERSAGIILSGKKGMGKSMFAQLISTTFANTYDMPTIFVSDAFPGVVDFIESIKQDAIYLFDEFEKEFDSGEGHAQRGEQKPNNVNKETQEKLLGLFDGISQQKRLYVVTVNDIRKVNQYMINRPGRFHYHFQFNFPSSEEIQLYLKDKLLPAYQDQAVIVQRFSNRFDLNYDSLRAIAFELNLGNKFLETMEDLNISSSENESSRYDIEIHHSNGVVAKMDENINLMTSSTTLRYYTPNSEYICIEFSPLEVNIQNKSFFIAEAGQVAFNVDYSEDNQMFTEESEITIQKIVFKKRDFGRASFGKELEGLLA
jgi:hypothetical protein